MFSVGHAVRNRQKKADVKNTFACLLTFLEQNIFLFDDKIGKVHMSLVRKYIFSGVQGLPLNIKILHNVRVCE